MTAAALLREALRLGAADRACLARELLKSLESLSEGEVEQLWLEEAERRHAEIDAGSAKTIPADEVFAQARARLRSP
jgi:putative addiction module component (TIGR02574 family)